MPKNFNDFLISKALESKKLADEILKMQIKLDQEKDLKKIDLKALKRSHKKLKAASQLLFQSSFELMHLSEEDNPVLDLSSLAEIDAQNENDT